MNWSCDASARMAVRTLGLLSVAWLLLAYAVAGQVSFVSSNPGQNSTVALETALLDNNVTSIILVDNVGVNASSDYAGPSKPPFLVARNVTITGLPDGWPTMNLRSVQALVWLCSTCVLTLDHIVTTEDRKGKAGAFDFVSGAAGSMVVAKNTYRLLSTCPPRSLSLDTLRNSARPANMTGTQSVKEPSSVTWEGVTYDNALGALNVAYDVPEVQQEGRAPLYGYTLVQDNVTHLCAHTVSNECAASQPLDVCVNQLLDSVGKPAAGGAAGQLAAVVVPCILGPLLLLGLGMGFALFWRRRRQGRQHGSQLQSPDAKSTDVPANGGLLLKSSLSGPSWFLAASSSAEGEEVQLEDIQLDMLLGAGSYGQVYVGYWKGKRVAVKLVRYDSRVADAVSNEVRLITSFDHPNIVKAYHFRTYLNDPSGKFQAKAEAAAAAAAAAAADAAGAARLELGSGSQDTRRAAAVAAEQQEASTKAGPAAVSLADAVRQTMAHLTGQQGESLTAASNITYTGALKAHGLWRTPSRSAPSNLGCSSQDSEVPLAASNNPWGDGAAQPGSTVVSASGQHVVIDVTAESHSGATQGEPQPPEAQQQPPGQQRQPQQQASTMPGQAAGPCYLVLDLPEELTQGKWVSGSEGGTSSEPTGSGLLLHGTGAGFFSGLGDTPEELPPPFAEEAADAGGSRSYVQQPGPGNSCSTSRPVDAAGSNAAVARQQEAPQAAAAARVVPRLGAVESAPSVLGWHRGRPRAGGGATAVAAAGGAGPPGACAHVEARSASGTATADAGAAAAAEDAGPLGSMVTAADLLRHGSADISGRTVMSADAVVEQAVSRAVASLSNRSSRRSTSGAGGSQQGPLIARRTTSSSGGNSSAGAAPAAQSPRASLGAQTLLVQEFCDSGTLHSYAGRWRHLPLDCPERVIGLLLLLRDAAAGLLYLHRRNVVHGSFCAHNVLVSGCADSCLGVVAKVSDFGQRSHHPSTRGTLSHLSPELLQLGRLSPAADVYAFGMTMWETLADEEAYPSLQHGAIFERVVHNGQRPDTSLPHLPLDAVALLRSCWSQSCADRPSMEAVLRCLNVMLEARCPVGPASGEPGTQAQDPTARHSHDDLVRDLW